MPIVDNLKDKAGNTIYPRTITEAIADPESGENLNEMLDGIVRTVGDESQEIEDLEESLGDVVTRHDGKIEDLEGYIGDLTGLTTEEKANLVNAINELKTKQDTHKAESASKHIAESGSNENGNYIKFDDGTMICTSQVTYDYNDTGLQSFPYPATFVGNVNPSIGHNGAMFSSTLNLRASVFTVVAPASTGWNVRTRENNVNLQETIRLTAIGRWK